MSTPGSMENQPIRIVIEDDDEARAWLDQEALKAAGYEVQICNGREAYPGRQCLLARDGWCPFLEGADAVLCHLPTRDKVDVVRRIREQYPEMVVVVEPEGSGDIQAAEVEMVEPNPVERSPSATALGRDVRAALRKFRK